MYLWLHYLNRGISTGKAVIVAVGDEGFCIDYIQHKLRRMMP